MNSKIKKKIKIDEILKAKQFYEKALGNQIEISEESKENFKKLFNNIINEFKNINK